MVAVTSRCVVIDSACARWVMYCSAARLGEWKPKMFSGAQVEDTEEVGAFL